MNPCPSNERLASLRDGTLAEAEALSLEHHVRACEECRQKLDRLRRGKTAPSVVGSRKGGSALMASDDTTAADTKRHVAAPRGGAGPSENTQSFRIEPDDVHPPLAAANSGLKPKDQPKGSSASGGDIAGWSIPDYEPMIPCGEGAFGSVWVVRDRVGVYRALKMIDLRRLRQTKVDSYEINALQAYCRKVSRHPFLITIFHVGQVDDTLYYTMELADHQSGPVDPVKGVPEGYRPLNLRGILQTKKLNPDTSMDIVCRLLRGLARLHELDLVHRDVKPSNIIFVNGQPKLADIGVLTSVSDALKGVGTPRYMPPDRRMDKTGDTYAAGKILHELLAGPTPERFPELPDDARWGSMRWDLDLVSQVIVKACAASADERFPSASAMLEELEACARLSHASLFDEVRLREPPPEHHPMGIWVKVAFAFISRIPWIAGLILVIYLLNKYG